MWKRQLDKGGTKGSSSSITNLRQKENKASGVPVLQFTQREQEREKKGGENKETTGTETISGWRRKKKQENKGRGWR